MNHDTPIISYFTKGEAEITNSDHVNHSGLDTWSDAEFCRDAISCCSTTRTEHAYDNASFS